MTVFAQTLLDLGASTDYKDSRGLTPLYHSAMVGGDPYCCELLLHDYAKVGCVDENGWQEIHQVSGWMGAWTGLGRWTYPTGGSAQSCPWPLPQPSLPPSLSRPLWSRPVAMGTCSIWSTSSSTGQT